jgi:small subunit ribosomal protein S17
MDKTIVVSIDRLVKHPLYKKYIHKRTKIKAHDEKDEAKLGDKVEIIECRPLSKEKHFRLLRILNKEK